MARPQPSDAQLAKVLSHPMRPRILEVLMAHGEASPRQIASELGSPLGVVSYHVRILRDAGWLALVRAEPRRGAVEHFYRPEGPPFVDDTRWERLPLAVRRRLAGQTVGEILEVAAEAAQRGGFDGARAHVSRLPLRLDDEGWGELAKLLAEALDAAWAIQRRSDERAASGSASPPEPSQLAILHHALESDDGKG